MRLKRCGVKERIKLRVLEPLSFLAILGSSTPVLPSHHTPIQHQMKGERLLPSPIRRPGQPEAAAADKSVEEIGQQPVTDKSIEEIEIV
jgi:hypothetical protein